jgi:hypothetical protein
VKKNVLRTEDYCLQEEMLREGQMGKKMVNTRCTEKRNKKIENKINSQAT